MKKIYPKLYSRDSKSKIRIWYMEQENGKYRTVSGLQDGERVVSNWTEAVSKNETKINATNTIEQASAEIESKYTKQLKTGYHVDLQDVDKELYISPMLAKNFNDRKDKIEYPVIVQIKFNGARCIATKQGLHTRRGEKYISTPHIEKSLIEFFNKHPDAIIDGELFCGAEYKQKLNETMKLVRKTVHISPEDLTNSEKLVKYYVYDILNVNGITENSDYLARAAQIQLSLHKNPYYERVESFICKNEQEVLEYFNAFMQNNEEGAIIRLLNKPYEFKRSANLLKLKNEDDDEAEIVEIFEGRGNWAKTGKMMKLKWKGITFDATLRGDYAEAKQFLRDKDKWIGRTVTFLYNNLTGLGVPNYARVDYANCLKSDI